MDTSRLVVVEVVFDQRNPNWNTSFEYNNLFLRSQAQFLDHKLNAQGHLFLNEVFDALGFPRTQSGVLNGWLSTPDRPHPIFEFEMNPDNNNGLIRFITQGPIHDKI